MPTVSVKLPDATKERLDRIAAKEGTTPHAFMLGAIEAELRRRDQRRSFIDDALRARNEMLASGKAYDGEEFLAYFRAKMRGDKVDRPRMKSLKTLLKKNPK